MVTARASSLLRASAILLATGAIAAGAGCAGPVDGLDGSDEAAERAAERAFFESEVVPVFESACGSSACHAADGDRFERLDESYFLFPVDEAGHITGADRVEKARERAVEKLSAEGARFSDLIRKPLDESLGGRVHRGGDQFRSMEDASLKVLLHWAEMARAKEEPTLDPLVARYRDEVQPILAGRTCMMSSCHGASAANLLIFDPGFLGEFDSGTTKRNYQKVQLHMAFESPDPMLSRLVRKTIPLDRGGIPHRGGNAFFTPGGDDPELETLLAFVRDARVELGDDDKGVIEGVVFAAADATPRRLFDIAVWQPGGDVYSLVPATPGGTLTNLTRDLHSGSADVRDPAVSYDGTRIAFSMRKSESDCLNLYVMDRDGGNLIQVTHDSGVLPNGVKVSNVEPLWGPDDRLYFTSTKAGTLSAQGGYPLSNMWRVDADGSGLLRMTFSAGNELSPAWRFFPDPGAERAEVRTLDLTFTASRRVGDRMFAPLMRVPPDFRADYHPHYGTQHPDYQIFTAMTQLPDLREPLILMDEENLWEGGALALIDRNLGPVIKDGGKASVVNYIEGLQKLGAPGEDVAHRGFSAAGYYRDPHAMPDGSVVVSHSPLPITHSDAEAAPDPAIYRLVISDLPANGRAIVTKKELLVDVPGKVESDPAPLYRRRREEIGDPLHHLENGRETGTVLTFDQAVQLTIGTEDSPSNTKEFDEMAEAIQWVRLVEEVAPEPADFPEWPDVGASRVGRGGHGVRRVLAEFPATADRSMFVELPAGVPYFVQAVDGSGAASTTFNQWFFTLPGETLKQVTRREVWNSRCGACHGSISGVPGETVAKPDILAEASRVVANYDPQTDTDKPPVPFGIEPGDRGEVDFEIDVQPILSARCASGSCHGGAIGPNLSERSGDEGFSGAYEALTAPGGDSGNGFAYVDAASSRAKTSYLAEVLLASELDAPRVFDSQGCAGPEVLTPDERALLLRWMDLGANYLGTAPLTKPALPTY